MSQTPAPLNAPKMSAFSVPVGATIVTLLLVIAGSLGLVLFQVPLMEQTQDLRGDASISNGDVFITTSPATSTKLEIGREAKVDVQLNTQGRNISQIELVFNVVTGATDQVAIQTFSNYGLQVTQQEIEETSDGFLMSFKAQPSTGSNWSNTSPQNVMSLVFTPKDTGTFKLVFDTDKSKAQTAEGDRLKTVGTLEYLIYAPLSSGKACNESCSNNNECQGNQRCYEGRCRLATNPSSTTCANPEAKIQQCDQTCTSTAQCAGALVCHNNRCRRADNPESASCVTSTAAQQEAMRSNCNQPCTDNRGCSVNHRCYQGYCRLATNPGSLSCSSAKAPTVSGTYYPSKGGPQKGEEIPVTPTPTASISARPTPSPTSTSGATLSGRVTPTPRASIAPTTSPLPTPAAMTNGSIFSRLTQGTRNLLLMIMLGVGGLLIAIALLLLISRLFSRKSSSSGPVTVQKNKNYEQELQAKIERLKQGEPVAPAGPVPAGAPVPKMPAAPVVAPAPTTPSPVSAASPSPDSAPLTPPPSTMRPQPVVAPSSRVAPVTSVPPASDLSPKPGATAYAPPKPVTQPSPKPVASGARPLPPMSPKPASPAPAQPRPQLSAAPVKPALPTSTTQQLTPKAAPTPPTPEATGNASAARPSSSTMLDRMKQRGIATPMMGKDTPTKS